MTTAIPAQGGSVTVTAATASGNATQFIGNTTIGTFHAGPSKEAQEQRLREEVLAWLSPPVEALKLQQFIHDESRVNRKLDDSGLWFVHGQPFSDWLAGRSRLAWLNGPMGCGKTTLFFLAVEEVRKHCAAGTEHRFAYFYCTSRGTLGQDIRVLFRTMLRQLWPQEEVVKAVDALFKQCGEGLDRREPTIRELALALKTELSTTSAIHYLLVDGLDELEPSPLMDFVEQLQVLVESASGNLRVMVASRAQPQIEGLLHDIDSWDSWLIDPRIVQGDIRKFVSSQIQMHRPLRNLPRTTHEEILSKVADKSEGMFRWAYLQMQALKALRAPVTPKKIAVELSRLPKTLDLSYSKILESLDEFDRATARRALRLLLYSSRQLYIEELADACAIDVDADELTENKYEPVQVAELLRDLVSVRPPLSEDEDVDSKVHTVILVHASIREFLTRKAASTGESPAGHVFFMEEAAMSHRILARDCLIYLLRYNKFELRHESKNHAFLRYAWYHWEEHIQPISASFAVTLQTTTMRRTASQLFPHIKTYVQDWRMFEFTPSTATLMEILLDVQHFASDKSIDLRDLEVSLNTPFFHPNYDKFFKAQTKSLDSGGDMRALLTKQPRSTASPSERGNSYYPHRPLRTPDSIRLLEILPAVDPGTTIRCRLYQTDIDTAPPFAALSYSWSWQGAETHMVSIEGYDWPALPSQLVLLRSMRTRTEHTEATPAIWLDAFCINQNDTTEVSHQIMMMAKVFSSAREVVIGLDNGDDAEDPMVNDFADSVWAVDRLARLRDTPTADDDDRFETDLLSLGRSMKLQRAFELFDNYWWTRTWPIQEVVLATQAVVLVGTSSINFDLVQHFVSASEHLIQSGTAFSLLRPQSQGWYHACRMIQTRLDHREGKTFSLPQLLWRFRFTTATDPRDSVFGFLGMCASGVVSAMPVDYSLGQHDTSLAVSEWMLTNWKNLDLLSVRSAFEAEEGHQGNSWIWPVLRTLSVRLPLHVGMFGESSQDGPLYSAAGHYIGSAVISRVSGGMLSVMGTVVDEVELVSDPVEHNLVAFHKRLESLCERIARWQESENDEHLKGQRTVEVRWRILLADQWPEGQRLKSSNLGGVPLPPTTEEEEQALLAEFRRHVPDSNFIDGRSVALTRAGRLGLVDDRVCPGDVITIMPGGALPFVLRQLESGQYTLLGECYFHGCVDGELVQDCGADTEWWTTSFDIV